MGLETVYERAVSCTSGPTDGAKALAAWVLGAYADKGARNLGIYNCRPIRGTNNTTSLHGEGRAWDCGFPVGDPDGDALAILLQQNSDELDIQCIIYERKIWSSAHPGEGWRYYSGTNPHTDHLHIELNWQGARTLTADRIQAVLGGSTVFVPVGVFTPKGPRLLRKGDKGDDVKVLQERLIGLGYDLSPYGADGNFGSDTMLAVRELQGNAGLKQDGIVGPKTREALDRGVRAVVRNIGYNFPLPAGHWFGVVSRNPKNHSGFWSGDRTHILAAMRGLRKRGWKNVPLIDRYTNEVRAAVIKYQEDAGLSQDGFLGAETWESIDKSPVR